jgi:tRNA-specific 2-thiouridylase
VKKRIVAAMSGGVDSSVAAALLVEQGHEVIGVTLNVEPREVEDANLERADACCSLSAVEDARRVADRLGIPHYALNFKDLFRERVIDDFVAEYRRGRTPNPCIRCNEHVKFEAVLHRLHALDADLVATGHYARSDRDPQTGRWRLRRGLDAGKDQSYVLYPLSQALLARSLFPLGGMTKDEVRATARRLGLVTADKPESQEICFVASGGYADFIARMSPDAIRPGPIVDTSGRLRGQHRGVVHYTIGQRRGLFLSSPEPLFVTEIDAEHNTIVVGPEHELFRRGFLVERMNWVSIAPPDRPFGAEVKIRSRAHGVPCTLEPRGDGRGRAELEQPQKAVTPGQAAVFYDRDVVLGGGTIDRALPERTDELDTPPLAVAG